MNKLEDYGLSPFFTEQVKDIKEFAIGRVIKDYGSRFTILCIDGNYHAEITGKLRYESTMLPVIGDWVVIDKIDSKYAVIRKILTRKTAFVRKAAGNETIAQVQGANFDTVFIVSSLNGDFNVRKIERFVTTAWDTGAEPVVVLTKSDLCLNAQRFILEAQRVAPAVKVLAVSAVTKEGLDELTPYISQGKTVALFGASGVGKSTLINAFAQSEIMKVNSIRESDARGKHTTTHRQLIVLPSGGMLIDTPGMRELSLWDDSAGILESFSDIESLACDCKFNDCGHKQEPGCAVRNAILSGELEEARLLSYEKLKREIAYVQRKHEQRLRMEKSRRR